MQHSGGWDRDLIGFRPFASAREIAEWMGVQPPANAETIIRFMMGEPLQFAPGARYAYSNLGYSVLGRIIEKITEENYEDFVTTHMLKPIGITQMRIGHTLLEDQVYREVHYYDYPGAPLAQSVFPEIIELVPSPYGGFYQEALDSCGGWIASVINLMRLVTSVDGHNIRPDILQKSTIELMISRPELSDWENSDWYYGMGWWVYPINGETHWSHSGSLPGARSYIVRSYQGLAWVALFNSNPLDRNTFIIELDNAIWQAIDNITEWPSHDLFDNYPTEYSLLISSTVGGSTSPSTGSYTCASGTHIQITAISDTGYRFAGWTGNVPSGHENDNPITITINSNKSIKANFIRIIYSPLNFTGEKVLNYSLSQDEYINKLTWQANPNNENVDKYRIYQVKEGFQSLLTELNSETFEYWHRRVENDRKYTYALVAVNDKGREGTPAYTMVQ